MLTFEEICGIFCSENFFFGWYYVLRPTRRQLNLEDLLGWEQRIPRNSVWHALRTWREAHLKDEDFAGLYKATGRPAVSPARLTCALLIQMEQNWSDRQLEEATAFDDRVKYALGMGRSDPPLDAATLCRHRRRLLEHDYGQELFDRVVQQAKAEGFLSSEATVRLDSFLITGAAARQDTYTLLRRGILRLLTLAQCHGCRPQLEAVLERADYHKKGKPEIDWDDPAAREALLTSLVRDARRILQAVAELPAAPEELTRAADLLKRILDQDIVTGPDGRVALRQGVARDRILSVTDPEMRHGRKTQSQKTYGYKAVVSTGGEDGSLVTGVEVAGANVADSQLAESVLAQHTACGLEPGKLVADQAYGGGALRARLKEQGWEQYTPVASSVRSPRFTKYDFDVHTEEGWARCPAGHETRDLAFGRDGRGGRIPVFRFPAATCQECPLKDRCLNPRQQSRTLRLHPHEALLREARAKQKTPEFKAVYRRRCHIERTIAHLTRHGARRARYFGQLKVRFQVFMAAVVHNIKQLARLTAAREQALPEPATA